MADEENVSSDDTDAPQPDDKRVAHAVQLRQDVKAEIARRESAGEIRTRIVSILADEQIEKRIGQLTKAFAKREEMSRNLNAIRPDVVVYDPNDNKKKLFEGFTKAKTEERDKATQELAKLDRAIGKAVDNADYGDIQKFVGG